MKTKEEKTSGGSEQRLLSERSQWKSVIVVCQDYILLYHQPLSLQLSFAVTVTSNFYSSKYTSSHRSYFSLDRSPLWDVAFYWLASFFCSERGVTLYYIAVHPTKSCLSLSSYSFLLKGKMSISSSSFCLKEAWSMAGAFQSWLWRTC